MLANESSYLNVLLHVYNYVLLQYSCSLWPCILYYAPSYYNICSIITLLTIILS